MELKKYFKDSASGSIVTLALGIGYLFVSILHFGIQYYDLDKLISNIVISLLIFSFSYFLKIDSEREKDIEAISKKTDDIENKLIDFKNNLNRKEAI